MVSIWNRKWTKKKRVNGNVGCANSRKTQEPKKPLMKKTSPEEEGKVPFILSNLLKLGARFFGN